MSTPTQSHSITELRLYQDTAQEIVSGDTNSDSNIASGLTKGLTQQIPTLAELMESFETVTGWELAFNQNRSARNNPSGQSPVIT